MFTGILNKKRASKLYKTLLKKEGLCFDIGANMGYKSSILLSLNHPVIAFEPQEICYSTLLKLKVKYPGLEIQKLAVGAENSELDLLIGNHVEIATLSPKFKSYFTTDTTYWNQKKRVKVVTLNSQIEIYGIPKFCKIDVEGYEYEVLKNLSYKIPVIEFEFTGGFIKETIECILKLDALGNYNFNYILNEKPEFINKNWMSPQEIITEIKSMNIKNLHGNVFAKLL